MSLPKSQKGRIKPPLRPGGVRVDLPPMIRPRLLALAITLGFSVSLSAQTPAPNPHDKPAEKPAEKAEAKPDAAAEKKEEPKKDEAKKEEAKKDSVTEHSITLNGQKIDYTATAGTLPLKDAEGKTTADIFYIAYSRKGITDAATRPVTFSFNGGPGSSSVWMHMGLPLPTGG